MNRAGCLFAMAWLAAVGATANDAGDLVFPSDYPYRARAELLYENVQRGLEVTSESPGVKADLKADVFAVRLQTEVGPYARLDFDVGAMSAGSGSHKLMGGVGLRYLALTRDPWRAGAFGQVRYAPGLSDRLDLGERGAARVKYDLVEADAGFLVAYRLSLGPDFAIVPYAGPVVSILRLSGDESTGEGRERFRAEEDRLFGGVLGLGLEFQGGNGLRFEGRYFDDLSVSVAASLVF